MWIICLFAAFNQCLAQAGCQHLADEVNGLNAELKSLRAERNDLATDLAKAGSGKPAIAAQIKTLVKQIDAKEKERDAKQKQLEKCECSDPLDSFKLPFTDDPHWLLCNGNWDDPVNGHNKGDPNGGQAYAFDFVYSPNNNCLVGSEGHNIEAMRAGVVISLAGDRSCNVWGVKAGDPCYGAPGEGNYVLIRHADNTVAAYDHLKKDSLMVKMGQQVTTGQVIALSGNTGNSSTPHVHVDVRKYWNSPSDFGPTLRIEFQDKNHACWRPKVGDVLASNNQ